MRKIWLTAIACAVTAAFAVPAEARTVRAGTLNCTSGTTVGLLVGSRQNLRCVFRTNYGHQYSYTGSVTRIGLDIGITTGSRFVWAVFAPSSRVSQGVLRGNYVGASGSASLGPGVGANVLVGGSNQTISLQPLSVEGRTGVNLAVGVANLALR
ncbi:MAG: DUF992 domain-containing protein [Afipia sp.]|jgi:hypothetical protein|nr:DUF992 domain-containing protein [Afipia sp.]